MDKNFIKNVKIGEKHIVTLYNQTNKSLNKVILTNEGNEALYKIFYNMVKRNWEPYPSASHGLWKYLQAYIIQYSKDKSIYISDSNITKESVLFKVFIEKFNEAKKHKEKYVIKTKNDFFLYKKKDFNFGLSDKNNRYIFTYPEKELFVILNKNNPIFSNIEITVLD